MASEYDEACTALGRVVANRGASLLEFHAALARLARAARAERVASRHVLACLHGLIAKSPLAEANRTSGGEWYASARRLVATEYYGASRAGPDAI